MFLRFPFVCCIKLFSSLLSYEFPFLNSGLRAKIRAYIVRCAAVLRLFCSGYSIHLWLSLFNKVIPGRVSRQYIKVACLLHSHGFVSRTIPFPYSFGSRVGYCSIRRYSVPFRFIASASSPHPNNYVCWPRNSSCGSWYLCRPATRFFVNWFPHYSHSSRYQRSTIRIIHAVNSFTIWHPSPYARRLFGDVHARRERDTGRARRPII